MIYFVPETPVFLDDRCELFAQPLTASSGQQREALLLDYAEGRFQNPARFDDWAKEFGITHALTKNETKPGEEGPGPFTKYLQQSPDWELVKETPAASLFRKKKTTSVGK